MPTGPTRRDLLVSLGKASAVTGVAGTGAVGYRISTLPLDVRNVRMVSSVLTRLARSSVVDWRYTWSAAVSHVPALPLLTRDAAAGLQALSAEETDEAGRHRLGSPLGWSSSALVLALTKRYRDDAG